MRQTPALGGLHSALEISSWKLNCNLNRAYRKGLPASNPHTSFFESHKIADKLPLAAVWSCVTFQQQRNLSFASHCFYLLSLPLWCLWCLTPCSCRTLGIDLPHGCASLWSVFCSPFLYPTARDHQKGLSLFTLLQIRLHTTENVELQHEKGVY